MAKGDNIERFAFIYELEEKKFQVAMKKVTDSVDTFTKATQKGLDRFVEDLKSARDAVLRYAGNKVIRALDLIGIPIERQAQAFMLISKGAKIASKAIGGMARGGKMFTSFIGKAATGFKKTARSAFDSQVSMGNILGIVMKIAKMGGMAVLLGPLMPLIDPFMKLVSIIVDTLQPAMEVIEGAMTAAFAPLAVAFQKLAVKILPYLMKVIDPIVAMLVGLVENFTTFFADMPFEQLTDTFMELVPLVNELVTSFVKEFLAPTAIKMVKVIMGVVQKLVVFAVKFVKTISPYLPKFFVILQKVADLILSALGKALDTLLEELIKQLPTLVPLIESMLQLFEALLPILIKLLPPLLELFANVLGKFLVPGMIKLLDQMVQGLIALVEASGPAIEMIQDVLETLNEWWERNEDVFPQFWSTIEEGGKEVVDLLVKAGETIVEFFKDAKEVADYLVETTTKWLGKLKKALEYVGLIKGESEEDKGIRAGQAAEASLEQERERIATQMEAYRAAGWQEEAIAAKRAELEAGAFVRSENLRARVLTGVEEKQEGGYIPSRQLVVAGEKGPEWVVPDTPEGLTEYIPKMIRSVLGGAPAMGAVTAAPVSMAGVQDLLRETNRLLKAIELNLADQSDNVGLLPEGLN